MTHSAANEGDDAISLHQIVADGNLDTLQAALMAGAAVDAPGKAGMTALMLAMDLKDLAKAELLIQHAADIELTDDVNDTALRYAVKADFADGVRLLLSLGADRGHHPRYPLKKYDCEHPFPDMPMPAEFKAFMTEAQWQENHRKLQDQMRERGQNPTVGPIIEDVQSAEVLRLFWQAGDDFDLAPARVRRAVLGLDTGGELRITSEEYQTHKRPLYGSCNPEKMDFPFWREMIRTGVDAYVARRKFNDKPSASRGAVWCYQRFGSSVTPLPDGRFVQIGGEHEDWYDPDFFIYNDVVVHDGKGDFQIFGYPPDVFPPTDSHTATLCGSCIYIIGCLGYPKQREPGVTPVYRLILGTWRIESVKAVGELPGWIYRHNARYEPDRNVICVEGGEIEEVRANGEFERVTNKERFELDLNRLRWRCAK